RREEDSSFCIPLGLPRDALNIAADAHQNLQSHGTVGIRFCEHQPYDIHGAGNGSCQRFPFGLQSCKKAFSTTGGNEPSTMSTH
ncbi:MAG: hypothetical protein V2I76_15060, partial [Roseobacter sp.]|nr:hypothetical protein [Roseobacter sp.]